MPRKILTIEYDTDQDFFGSEGDEPLLGCLANEFDNNKIIARLEEGDTIRLEREIVQACPAWDPDELINASRALLTAFGSDASDWPRPYLLALERALP